MDTGYHKSHVRKFPSGLALAVAAERLQSTKATLLLGSDVFDKERRRRYRRKGGTTSMEKSVKYLAIMSEKC